MSERWKSSGYWAVKAISALVGQLAFWLLLSTLGISVSWLALIPALVFHVILSAGDAVCDIVWPLQVEPPKKETVTLRSGIENGLYK